MNHRSEDKESVVISFEEYKETEQRWFEKSLETHVVVVDEDGKRLFSMELVKEDEEPHPAAAE